MSEIDHSADQTALEWLARRHSGCWSAVDEQAHAAWLAADAEHVAAWQRIQAVWHELAGLRPFAAAELRAARAVRPPRRAPWRAGLSFAGLGVLAFGLATFWLPGSLAPAQSYQTAKGKQRTITLADGSTVELNTDSKVTVDYGLACRCLRLSGGEAVFRVAHDDIRGFKVEAGNIRIRDIGTEFWVRSESAKTSVAVLEGEIEVAAESNGAPTRLHAGGELAYDRMGRPLAGADRPVADLVAWREGAIVFRDAPLTAVLAEFSRYHAVSIDADARLQGYRLSGRLESARLDDLLRLIQSAYPVRVRRPAPGRLIIDLVGNRGA